MAGHRVNYIYIYCEGLYKRRIILKFSLKILNEIVDYFKWLEIRCIGELLGIRKSILV
jgi:hypothetical protein